MKHLTEEALDLGDKKKIDRDAPGEPFYQALEKVLSNEDDSDVDSVEDGLENLLKAYPDEPFWSGWPAMEAKANGNKEEKAALYMLISQFIRRGLAPIDADKCESSVRSGLFRLVAAGAAVIVPGKQGELIEESQSMVLLSPWACRTLFRQSSPVDCLGFMGQECDVLSADAIPARELFFDRRQEEQYKEMVRIADEGVFGQIAERCVAKGFPAGVACLLYGPPGTGKTEAVRQVARASGRSLLVVDAAKINGRYIGDSEKLIRELFRNYRYLQALSPVAPILLFNEADGLLWPREQAPDGAAGRAYNIMQSVLLQELESFEGLLFATTNMPGTVDAALGRRFLQKLEWGIPSSETRKRIWQSEMPGISAELAAELSERFPLSGGGIHNVAYRCGIQEILRGEPMGRDVLISYCQDEMALSAPGKGSGPVMYGKIATPRGDAS